MNEINLQRQIDSHEKRLESHGAHIDSLNEWRAQAKGFLLALTVFASLPTVVLGYMALAGAFSK